MSTINFNENSLDENPQDNRYLTFTVGNEFYGVEIINVIEIVGIQTIIKLPEVPEYIKGIINLRDKIIPVMDCRLRFKKASINYNDRTCIVVINIGDTNLGLIIDSVSEVTSIPEDKIVPPPNLSKEGRKYIKGIGKDDKQIVLLLDCEELLNEDEKFNLVNQI
ncbi:chemotaxis protein CheW [Clostridium sp. DL1XJH146]